MLLGEITISPLRTIEGKTKAVAIFGRGIAVEKAIDKRGHV